MKPSCHAGSGKMDGLPSQLPPMPHFEGDLRAPDGARFAILASRWNPRVVDALVAGARKAFADHGVDEAAIDVVRVPGAWELPLAAFIDREVEQVDQVERAALRIAAYELLHRADIPYRVVINEAIDSTKRFGSEHGHTYVNGVLDKAAAEWRAPEFNAARRPQ